MVHMKWKSDGLNGNLRAADETRPNRFLYDVNKKDRKRFTRHGYSNTPGEQLVQLSAPVLLLKEPAGQGLHKGLPVILEAQLLE